MKLFLNRVKFISLLVLIIVLNACSLRIAKKSPNDVLISPQATAKQEILVSPKRSNGKAMVVAAHHNASEVGVAILKKGGNAIDAAIAVHFALSVVYPNAGNIGGGGFLVYRAANGETDALDFRETAPL